MAIYEICVPHVVHSPRDTTIQEAAQYMRRHHVGDLVVTDRVNGITIPVGIVTDRDIVLSVVAPGLDPKAITVGDIMNDNLVTIRGELGLMDALQKMRVHGVRRIPVVRESGELVGILTLDDLLGLLAEEMGEVSKLIAREHSRELRARA